MFIQLKEAMPTENMLIHILAIGGIGMSGIAEILHNIGYKVQGSDIAESTNIDRLRSMGIKCFIGHDANNIQGATLIIQSTAVKDNCPEIIEAKKQQIRIIHRSEIMKEIMRFKFTINISGSHGKTTTSALVAELFAKANLHPTLINGGIVNQKGSNTYLGEGSYIIAEADESDGTFIKIPSSIAVITNIDPEHLDYYGDFNNLKNAFVSFIEGVPFYGMAVVCYDDDVVREVSALAKNRNIITYGVECDDADVTASNIKTTSQGMTFDVAISNKMQKAFALSYSEIKDIKLGILGKHNVSNALAAIAISIAKNFAVEIIKTGLADFGGVKRRFTKVDEIDDILIIDDYAHHPAEIKATLATAKSLANARNGKVIAIMQPHRFSRLKDLMADFASSFIDADVVVISDVYAASEKPIAMINADVLVNLTKHYHNLVLKLNDKTEIISVVKQHANANDIVIFLGAGDITKWAYELPKNLQNTN